MKELSDGKRAEAAPKVLIRTIPPNLNPNYGGILQAWALQSVLRGLGFDAWVDASLVPRDKRPTWINSGVRGIRSVKRRVVKTLPSAMIPTAWVHDAIRAEVNPILLKFAPARVPTVALYSEHRTLNPDVAGTFDAFIVGSDQVWRPEYVHVASNLLDFLDDKDRRPRLSYAASFGTNNPHFKAETREHLKSLAQRFAGVSVREASGVELAQDLWGVGAEHHVDPTMLIERGEYTRLASQAVDPLPGGRLIEYVLDEGPETRKTLADIEAEGTPILSLLPQLPSRYREFSGNPDAYRPPSVESWLGAIASAKFVVTDSYHGTVFAIVNNVPFLAVVNHMRGASRFESLLSTFGLEDRLVEPGSRVSQKLVSDPIDWAPVNERIVTERMRAIDYLRESLSPLLDRSSEPAP